MNVKTIKLFTCIIVFLFMITGGIFSLESQEAANAAGTVVSFVEADGDLLLEETEQAVVEEDVEDSGSAVDVEVIKVAEEPQVIKKVMELELDTQIVKKEYLRNEGLDLNGLTVFLVYNTGEKELLTQEDYSINEVDLTKCGNKEIVVSYGQLSQSFFVEVTYVVTEIEAMSGYASTSLNLRNGPGTEFDKLISIPLNTEVTAIGETENGWAKVIYEGEEYFCSGKYLMAEKKVIVEPDKDNATTRSVTNLDGLVFDGPVSQACKDKAIELYSLVPQNVKDAIMSRGFQVLVTTDPTWTDGSAGAYRAIEWTDYYPDDPKANSIAIYAGSVGKVNIALIHEIGHFIDNHIGKRDGYGKSPNHGYMAVTSSEEWVEIYKAEASFSGFKSYVTDAQEDYFAEVVWKALSSPSWCKKTLPRSYEFVMNCINNV